MNTKKFTISFIVTLFFTGILLGQSHTGLFDSQTDVGNCRYAGFGWFSPHDQTYTLGGAGANMWFGQDEFHYMWTTLQGDFILRAEVRFSGKGVEPHRKAGWIVRNDLNPHSPHVNATVHGNGLTSLQYRKITGGKTVEITSNDSFPSVIQLERQGNRWIMSTARFGETWTTIALDSKVLDHEVFAGIYVCSHNPDIVEAAVFRNVRIIIPAGPGLVPCRSGKWILTEDIKRN